MSYEKPKLKSRLNSPLISGSAVYVVANLIAAVTPFLLLPILTRYLPPNEYGEIAIFLKLISALSAIVGLLTKHPVRHIQIRLNFATSDRSNNSGGQFPRAL